MIDTLARELEAARGLETAGAIGRRRGELALVTLHRPSNVDGKDRLETLLGFLERIASRLPVVFPAHPRTRVRPPDGPDRISDMGHPRRPQALGDANADRRHASCSRAPPWVRRVC